MNMTKHATLIALLLAAACSKKDKPSSAPANQAGSGTPTTKPATPTDVGGAKPVAAAAAGPLRRFAEPTLSHPDALDQIVSGPDGTVLTCSRSAVRVWDRAGKLRWGRAASLRPGACALSADGKRVAVIERHGDDGAPYQPRMYTVGGGEGTWLDGASAATWLGFDGDALVTVHRDQVERWDGGKATALARLPAAARAADLAPDGKTLVWTDGTKVYSHAIDDAPIALSAAADGEIKHLALSADGKLIVLASDRKVALWEVGGAAARWTAKLDLSVPHTPAVEVGSDGTVLASRVQRVVTLAAADGAATTPATPARFLAWAAGGRARVVEGKNQTLVDVETGTATPAPDDGVPDWAGASAISADGTITAWDGDDCAPLRVWQSGQAERTLPSPSGCSADADGHGWHVGPHRAIGVGSKSATVFDLISGKELITIPLDERLVREIATSADGATVAVVLGPMGPTDDPQLADDPQRKQLLLQVWGVPGGERAHALRDDDISAVALSPDGRRMYLGTTRGTVEAVDAATLTAITQRGPHSSEVTSIDVEPTSGRIAVTDLDLETAIWPP